MYLQEVLRTNTEKAAMALHPVRQVQVLTAVTDLLELCFTIKIGLYIKLMVHMQQIQRYLHNISITDKYVIRRLVNE